MMRLVLISVSACVFIYLIHSYNNSNNLEQENAFERSMKKLELVNSTDLQTRR